MTKTTQAMVCVLTISALAAGCAGPRTLNEAATAPAATPVSAHQAATPPATAAAIPSGHPALDQAAVPTADAAAPIAPAKDGISIETIWKTRDALAGRTVTVRGKVVKFNGGILGVNWIHLQDGSGAADARTNDITVTSDAEAKVGEVVTVRGVIALNKDIGSGYQYPVIVERATIGRN
jgi:hypothetical protein